MQLRISGVFGRVRRSVRVFSLLAVAALHAPGLAAPLASGPGPVASASTATPPPSAARAAARPAPRARGAALASKAPEPSVHPAAASASGTSEPFVPSAAASASGTSEPFVPSAAGLASGTRDLGDAHEGVTAERNAEPGGPSLPAYPAPLPPSMPDSLRAPPLVPSSSAAPPAIAVKLADSPVFSLRVPLGAKVPELRAREATEALKRAFANEPPGADVSSRVRGSSALLSIGKTPIIELGEDDAKAAGASSLDAYAAATASSLRSAFTSERRRSQIATTAFSLSLVILFALIAFYLIRKLGEFAERARTWFEARRDRDLSLRFQNIELMRPATLRAGGLLALNTLRWLAQFGVAYTWLVVVLSLFESTRGYTEKLTGLVLAPISDLMERLATALPLVVVAGVVAVAVWFLVRFVGLFFASVGRGDTQLGWLPSDLAAPTSALLRMAIVISALVFLAPVVTGSEGALARLGSIALTALGLAATPVLASAGCGLIALYGRRLRVGEYVEFGAYRGMVAELNLLELRLTITDRTELRIPHLLTLVRPLRILGARPRLTVDLYVTPAASVTEVRSLLASVAAKVGAAPSVEIVSADIEAIRFRVAATCDSLDARTAFHIAALDALTGAGIALGKERP